MLTIAVSSRSLFHLEEANKIFENVGQAAFDADMVKNEDIPMEPGIAFPLVQKFLSLQNKEFSKETQRVKVIILSRNSPEAGVRIMNSVQHHKLPIETGVLRRARTVLGTPRQWTWIYS